MRKIIYFIKICLCIFFLATLIGCEVDKTSEKKIKDLDFTICDEKRLPPALVELIEDKKKEPFKLTYRTKDYMYIVIGYGCEDRTDIGVALTELYLTENAIFVDTKLVANKDKRLDGNMVSYPYIAVKCELYDVQVIFK